LAENGYFGNEELFLLVSSWVATATGAGAIFSFWLFLANFKSHLEVDLVAKRAIFAQKSPKNAVLLS